MRARFPGFGLFLVAALVMGGAQTARAESDSFGRPFCQRGQFADLQSGYVVDLAIERRTVSPGHFAYARLENRGEVGAGFGTPFWVQRFEHGDWHRAPRGPTGPWFMPLFFLGPGERGWCMRYRVAADAEPGRYRFVKRISRMDGTHDRAYTADFRVTRG
jgi:hypothetical protein